MVHVIRKCEERDLERLVELCQKHAAYEQAPYEPAGKLALLKKSIFSTQPLLYCYVIESHEKLAGYFSFTFDFSTWEASPFLYLDCLYLEPEYRGNNIGEKVFDILKDIAKKNHCINIQWQTPVFNDRAIKFYKRIGGMGKDKVRFFIDMEKDAG